jgi:hypothetical protein
MKKQKIILLALILFLGYFYPLTASAGILKDLGQPCSKNGDSECLSGDCEESNIEYNREKLWFCDCSNDQTCVDTYGNAGENWDCKNGGSGIPQSYGVDYCQKTGEPAIFPVTAERIRQGQQLFGAPALKEFGQYCTKDSECIYNQCENSDISELAFCTCDNDSNCVSEFGADSKCINGTPASHDVSFCQKGNEAPNYFVNEATIAAAKKAKAANFSNTLTGGLATDAARKSIELTAPKLAVQIPGLAAWKDRTIEAGETITVPYLVEYILALYKYAVVIGSVIAVVTFMIGGLLYMIAGGVPSSVATAQEVMIGAISGLTLILSAYLMLNIINPNLVHLKPIEIQTLEAEELAEVSQVSAESYQAVTGQKLDLSPVAKTVLLQKAAQKAQALDIPPCMLISIVAHESGGNPGIVGHDEDYPGPAVVGARYNFLASKKKFSGETFELPATFPATYGQWASLSTVERKKINSIKIFNDDGASGNRKTINLGAAPDFGLDWRFSHGLGLGQVTLKGSHFCSAGVRGIKLMDGRCYTIPELLTPDIGIQAMALVLKAHYRNAKQDAGYSGQNQTPPENVVRLAFAYYAGGRKYGPKMLNTEGQNKRMQHYAECVAKSAVVPPPTTNEPAFSSPVSMDDATQ